MRACCNSLRCEPPLPSAPLSPRAMAESNKPLSSNQQPQQKCYNKTRGKKETICITKTCNLVTVIYDPHLISREELCTVCISLFLLPSLIATTTAQATALQGVLQKLQNFQKKRSSRVGGEGVRTSDSEQFGGHDH